MTLLIKKPDYLGNSMWEFQLGGRAEEAKMGDKDWLDRFRANQFTLRPGDALRAVVRTDVAKGSEGQEVGVHYSVLHVLGIVHVPPEDQPNLL
jgi:hypothetical protein